MTRPTTSAHGPTAAPAHRPRRLIRMASIGHRLQLLAALLLSGAMTAACSHKQPPAKQPPRPVRVHRVEPTSGVPTRTFSGTARAGSESRLSFKVPGSLSQLSVKVGDRVKRGQTIAKLDDRDFKLQLGEAQAALSQALAQARNARAEYERVRGLYENRSASLKDLDAARAGADSARASASAARQRVNLARRQLQYCRLEAPLDGEIAAVPVEPNENVKANATIAILNSGAQPEVTIAVPESLIIKVSAGDRASVTFDAFGERRFTGLVTEVGVATTGDTTFPVVVELSDAHPGVRAGMAAEVAIAFGKVDPQQRIFVPTHTVLEDSQGRFVFVARPDGGDKSSSAREALIERRKVQIGRLTAEGIEIVDGLAKDDLVVDSGLRFVEAEMRVRLLDPLS